MKAVCKKLFSLLLVAVLLISVVPFQAFAAAIFAVYFYVAPHGTIVSIVPLRASVARFLLHPPLSTRFLITGRF